MRLLARTNERALDAGAVRQDNLKMVSFWQNRFPMFSPVKQSLVSIALVVATTLMGVAPASGSCEINSARIGVKHCNRTCCAKSSESAHSCCPTPSASQACCCSADSRHPVAPRERQTSDERDTSRRTEIMVALVIVPDDDMKTPALDDAHLDASLPAPQRQAFLCCWQV